jgi:tetratricopeptide (TPR) repeat protein
MKRDRGKRVPAPAQGLPALSRDRAWLRHVWAVLGLWGFALAVYSNSFETNLAADAAALLHDPRIATANAPGIMALFRQQYWASGTSGLYRPVATLSYMFNYAVLGNGLNPVGYHGLNFLLHAVNMLLVYLLGFIVFRKLGPALLLAGVWGGHPVLTESVTNIAGRPDLLAGFGVLAGLLAHIMSRGASGGARVAWIAGLAASFTVGLFSKENAVVLIALMAVYDFTWRPRSWRRAIAGYLAVLLPLGVFLGLRGRALAVAPPMYVLFTDNPLMGADFWTARLTAVRVIGKYLGLLAWPGSLACDYSYNAIPLFGWRFRSASDWATLAALAACLTAAAAAVLSYRRCREAWFFLAFFAITLAPASNLLLRIGTIMAERFLYLPTIAFAGCLVLAAKRLAERFGTHRRMLVPAAAAALCCAFGARTHARNADWSDERSLWESTVRAVPDNAKAHITLADILMDPKGRDLPRAAEEADRAIAIVNGLPDARNIAADYAVAGRAYRLMGESITDDSRRMAWFRKAYETLLRGQRIDVAASEAVRRRPGGRFYATLGEPAVYAELGRIYPHLGEPLKAVEALQHARRIRPGSPDDEDSAALAGAYDSMGQWRQAAVALLEGQTLSPNNPAFLADVLDLYKQRDPQGCELQNIAGSSRLNLACPAVHEDLCSALANVARLRRARGEAGLGELTGHSAQVDFGCQAP